MGQQPSRTTHPNPSVSGLPSVTAVIGVTDVPAGADAPRRDFLSVFPLVGFICLTVNSIFSIRRSIHDPCTVAFVVVTYADLLLLYHCFRLVERTAASDYRRRRRLKAAVWSLATLLTALFAYRVGAIMPPVVAVIVWAMSAITIASGYYAMFLYGDAADKETTVAWKNPDACDKC